ncbi:transposase [Janibacter sp. GS2]|uniref:transposase n=1 Tax=Janibacter sp. GS2 TaxID=3442646 RepID=UPI003EB775D2
MTSGGQTGRGGYSAEFRRKVLDGLAAGRNVAAFAHGLGVSDRTIYGWPRQDRIDQGGAPGLSSTDKGEVTTANQRIRERETELAVDRRAVESLKEDTSPESRSAAVDVTPRKIGRCRSLAGVWVSPRRFPRASKSATSCTRCPARDAP